MRTRSWAIVPHPPWVIKGNHPPGGQPVMDGGHDAAVVLKGSAEHAVVPGAADQTTGKIGNISGMCTRITDVPGSASSRLRTPGGKQGAHCGWHGLDRRLWTVPPAPS